MSKRKDDDLVGGNGALARGRALMERGGPFPPSATPELLAAGRDPGFSPATDTTDAKIARFLSGAYGSRWAEEAGKPRPSRWTPAEAAEIAALAAVVEAKRLLWERARETWFDAQDAERVMAHSNVPIEAQLRDARVAGRVAAVAKAVSEAERLFHEASAELQRATGALNNAKLAAQNRRADEQAAR